MHGSKIMSAMFALTIVAAAAPSAHAIGNGEPDGAAHPNVGVFAIEHDGIREAGCSGFYAGPHRDHPGTGIFVTAAHCLADLPVFGISGSDLTVTFDEKITVDEETFAITATSWHPAFAYSTSAIDDYGVILLEDPLAGVAGVEFPEANLLDNLAARGALKPTTVFDNVGYGLIPRFERGQPEYEMPSGRMFATSKFLGLTKTHLKLLTNSDAGYGGGCYGDSGAPVLLEGSNTAVAFQSGGDPRCRAHAHPLRLDITAAREFYREYLQLP